MPKERADATELPELPEGIKRRKPWQREKKIFHSLCGVLEIPEPSEARGSQSNGPAVG